MKMPPLLLLAFLSLPGTCVRAQVTDDFEDGDLANPNWFGDTEDFVVADGRLRLMAEGAGESRLSVDLPANPSGQDFTLDFLVDMDFAPSASNLTTLLLEDCNGNACEEKGSIRIGGISGSDDRVEVFLTDEDVVTQISGAAGAVGSQPAVVRFRVQTNAGFATLRTDYDGGTSLTEEASQQTAGSRFNRLTIVCEYTATRADKFSFDDFGYAVEQVVDEAAPVLLSTTVVDASTLRLQFNETLEAASVSPPANYTFSGGITSVNSVSVQNGSAVVLSLTEPLPVNQAVTLTVARAADPSGNELTNATTALTFFLLNPPTADNVVLNEFLADPTPVIGLPNQEYVELYNPTDTVVDASRLSISSGGAPVSLPADARIPANGYLVLTADAAAELEALGATVAILNLPSLTNGGDNVSLLADDRLLVSIDYTDAWYNDPERDDGGYSLEYVGGGAAAGCSGSWKASEDATGGTPGRNNSVTGRVVDDRPPLVTGLSVTTTTVGISFNEVVNPNQFADSGLFSLNNGGTVLSSAVLDPEGFVVTLSVNLEVGTLYTLTLLPDYSDCSGNFAATAQTFPLAIPDEPAPGDVLINEILFNPASGGSDFVELYNASEKVFQTEGWVLANTRSTSATSAERTIAATRLFLPGDYLTFSADPDDLMQRYLDVDSSLLVDQTLPSLPNDEGNITVRAGNLVLDALDYSDDFHSPLIGDQDGVSLERIRPDPPTQDGNNWFSAAQVENFATPTRPNSQARSNPNVIDLPTNATFFLQTPTFSPDGDGFEDFLTLFYQTEAAAGALARVRIFDAQGRPVRTLREVELLGTRGTLRWDGSNDEGRRARAGIYVIYAEVFAPGADTKQEKLVAVLARD